MDLARVRVSVSAHSSLEVGTRAQLTAIYRLSIAYCVPWLCLSPDYLETQ